MRWHLFIFACAVQALGAQGVALAQQGDAAADRPPGLISAELLPGWVTPEGNRMTALALRLEPGWKTYWRSPGDAGVPPHFNWAAPERMGAITLHWPRPEAIESGGERSLGYHDALILPIEIAPAAADAGLDLSAVVDFGLCDDICVPVQVTLNAPPPGDAPDPRIEDALSRVPDISSDKPQCRVEEIPDGLRVTARFERQDAPEVAMELDDETVWVSQPELARAGGILTAQADFVDATGKPFDLDPARLRLTLIEPDRATEFLGCDTRVN